MDNIDINKLMQAINEMDKKQLEQGLTQVSKFLNNKQADEIINQIKNKKIKEW